MRFALFSRYGLFLLAEYGPNCPFWHQKKSHQQLSPKSSGKSRNGVLRGLHGLYPHGKINLDEKYFFIMEKIYFENFWFKIFQKIFFRKIKKAKFRNSKIWNFRLWKFWDFEFQIFKFWFFDFLKKYFRKIFKSKILKYFFSMMKKYFCPDFFLPQEHDRIFPTQSTRASGTASAVFRSTLGAGNPKIFPLNTP